MTWKDRASSAGWSLDIEDERDLCLFTLVRVSIPETTREKPSTLPFETLRFLYRREVTASFKHEQLRIRDTVAQLLGFLESDEILRPVENQAGNRDLTCGKAFGAAG
jgi:hypothetical protein